MKFLLTSILYYNNEYKMRGLLKEESVKMYRKLL